MRRRNATSEHAGFTLVELLVVIAIIALLVSILLPAMNMIKTKARATQALAQQKGLDAGIEAFRGESGLGGRLPPSATDDPMDRHRMARPDSVSPVSDMKVAGSHLLLQALLGGDLLGTPGFIDANRDGFWANDPHRGPGGLYELDSETLDPIRARYGGAGYVDDTMKSHVRSLADLHEDGTIAQWEEANVLLTHTGKLLLFVDPWDHPILYYRANPAARIMMGDGGAMPGIYRQEDNSIITGSDAHGPYAHTGIDFGPGAKGGYLHGIGRAMYPKIDATSINIEEHADYDHTLARFIHDTSQKARHTPVRRDSYLLISAGPDARYGTADDITNWKRDGG